MRILLSTKDKLYEKTQGIQNCKVLLLTSTVWSNKTGEWPVSQENINFRNNSQSCFPQIISLLPSGFFHSLSSVFKYSCSVSVSHLHRGNATELGVGLKRDILKVWYLNLENNFRYLICNYHCGTFSTAVFEPNTLRTKAARLRKHTQNLEGHLERSKLS
jgi:hypothetical protein